MPAGNGHAKTILVADDDAAVRQMLEMILQMEGFSVVNAADGQEAVNLYQSYKPDAVVLDIMMPNLTGLEVLDQIRTMHTTEGDMPPVIIVSAKGSDDDQWEGYRRGAAVYIAKPVEPEELVGLLNKLIR